MLVGEDRVVRQAQLLGALDLGIPVGALDQAAHEAQPVPARQPNDVLDQRQRARLVGLQRQAEAAPLRKVLRHLRRQRLEHVERQLQPVHLLGVDRQPDVGARSPLAQAPDPRHQLAHHPGMLRRLVARVQRAQFDGNPVFLLDSQRRMVRRCYFLNSILVARQVLQCIRIGAGALAQHVIAVAEIRLPAACAFGLGHAFLDGLAQHELAAQQLHGTQRGGHHGARAQPRHQARLLRGLPGAGGARQEFLGQGNRTGRQPGQGGIACGVEVGAAQLVRRQGNGGFCIGHTQQGFRQAHQGQAFGAGNRVFLEQAVHRPEGRRLVAHGLHPRCGHAGGRDPVQRAVQRGQAVGHDLGLRAIGKGQAVEFWALSVLLALLGAARRGGGG
ncbi:MAG: hypothetical protein BWX79_02406 [Alphaproteobacteria bacterium ADurb.Bin100]|nr:MAG: hypothetical protein BWX79_02406 [Alphaproteobacteria bacterium ADurb.Bin100]